MANVPWGIAAQTSCIARTVHLFQGDVNVGYPMSCDGLEKAEESGDAYSKAEAHLSMGTAYYLKRRLEDARKHLIISCDLSARIGFLLLQSAAEFGLGDTYFSLGNSEKSKKHLANAVRLMKSNDFVPSCRRGCELALARVMAFNREEIPNLDSLFGYVDRNTIKFNAGRIRRYLAEMMLYLNISDMQKADRLIQEAIAIDSQNKNFFDLPQDLAVSAEIYKRMGDQSRVIAALSEAIRIYRECGADGWVEKYEKELVSLS